jgi:hypothetical protein
MTTKILLILFLMINVFAETNTTYINTTKQKYLGNFNIDKFSKIINKKENTVTKDEMDYIVFYEKDFLKYLEDRKNDNTELTKLSISAIDFIHDKPSGGWYSTGGWRHETGEWRHEGEGKWASDGVWQPVEIEANMATGGAFD